MKPAEEWPEQCLKHWFHQDAKTQARQRDSKLDRADRGIQVFCEMPDDFCAAMLPKGGRFELGFADSYERQLRSHKKAVHQHQRHNAEYPEQIGQQYVHITIAPRRK